MTAMLVISGFALFMGALVTWVSARGQGWRWGWRPVQLAAADEGVYRSAPVTVRAPRRMPTVCGVAAVTSVAWGTLTVFVFAPAGVVGCLVVAPQASVGVLGVVGLIGISAVTLHGFYLGVLLIGLVKPITVRASGAGERLGRAAGASFAHHGAVVLSFACLSAADHEVVWVGMAAVPCAIGALQACLLLAARAAHVRLDREDAARGDLAAA
ncbi:MAG TPA: hypothetical protein VK698_33550 [Kofleriaceae bacterium]|nr:hypothetical protein [Kofleriaceae bacterium]